MFQEEAFWNVKPDDFSRFNIFFRSFKMNRKASDLSEA